MNLRIVLGHLGEDIPTWLWCLDNISATTRRVAGEQLGMFDPAIQRFVMDVLGADRVLFAVDYPYEDTTPAVTSLADTSMTADEREKVAHGNAERLFRIPSRSEV